MPLTVRIATDIAARARASELQPRLNQETLSYLLTGAVGVGLNRWTLRRQDFPPGPSFTPKAGEEVVMLDVDVTDRDLARASALAIAIGADVQHVLSAALCTGLGKLVGDPATRGPFLVPADARDTDPPAAEDE